jgi:hypothetical protein
MSAQLLEKLIQETNELSVQEQLRLAAYLVERASEAVSAPERPLKWQDILGLMPYPLVGEDAQAWVSRTRRESDEQRDRRLRHET